MRVPPRRVLLGEVGAGSIPVGAGNITEETAIKTGQQPADQHGELSTLQWLDEVNSSDAGVAPLRSALKPNEIENCKLW